MLQDVDIEAAIQYALDFIHAVGMPELFEDKEADIPIVDYRGKLPCDLVSINQVKDKKSRLCLRSTTDNFLSREGRCGCHHTCEDTFKV